MCKGSCFYSSFASIIYFLDVSQSFLFSNFILCVSRGCTFHVYRCGHVQQYTCGSQKTTSICLPLHSTLAPLLLLSQARYPHTWGSSVFTSHSGHWKYRSLFHCTYYFWVFFFFFGGGDVEDRVSLCSSGYPETHFVGQAQTHRSTVSASHMVHTTIITQLCTKLLCRFWGSKCGGQAHCLHHLTRPYIRPSDEAQVEFN